MQVSVTEAHGSETPDPRRWLILGTVGLAQLMVVLDATIGPLHLPAPPAADPARTAMPQVGQAPVMHI